MRLRSLDSIVEDNARGGGVFIGTLSKARLIACGCLMYVCDMAFWIGCPPQCQTLIPLYIPTEGQKTRLDYLRSIGRVSIREKSTDRDISIQAPQDKEGQTRWSSKTETTFPGLTG